MKPRWLSRDIAYPAPYMTLCLTENEYLGTMRWLKVANPPSWRSKGAACVNLLEHPEHGVCAVVCMPEETFLGEDPVAVAAMLVHEAVHIWQQYADHIGETEPGREQEAYAIQSISQTLMGEFARRMENWA